MTQSSLFHILLDHLSELKLGGTADLLIIADASPALLHDDGRVELIPDTVPTPRELLEDEITKQWNLRPELNHPYDAAFEHDSTSYQVLIHDGGDLLSVSFHPAGPVEPPKPAKPVRSLRNVKPTKESKV